MLHVMFASITLKYTNQTVYSATCSSACTLGMSWTYKGHLEEVMDVYPISVLCLVGQRHFQHLIDNYPVNNAR